MSEERLIALRKQISEQTIEILKLLNQRAETARQIANIKYELGLPVLDADREDKLLEDLVAHNQGPVDNKAVQEIFKTILSCSRQLMQSEIDKLKPPG